jgi:ubiquinone/menaquinone biosynthesis C-methylase UbiE
MENIVIEHFKKRLQKGDYASRYFELKRLPKKDLKGRLLEVGCGALLTYSPEKLEVYGIDIMPEMIKLFKKSYPNAHAVIGDARALPFKAKCFDVVVVRALLHHLIGSNPRKCRDNIKIAMKEMKQVLNKNAILLIRESVVRNYLFQVIMFYISLVCAKLNIEINSLDIHSKVITYFITEKEFKQLCSENLFGIEELESEDWRLQKICLGKSVDFLLTQKRNSHENESMCAFSQFKLIRF